MKLLEKADQQLLAEHQEVQIALQLEVYILEEQQMPGVVEAALDIMVVEEDQIMEILVQAVVAAAPL